LKDITPCLLPQIGEAGGGFRARIHTITAYALARRPDAAGIATCADLMGLIAAPL